MTKIVALIVTVDVAVVGLPVIGGAYMFLQHITDTLLQMIH